jgi:flagella basal body P-ring formation protein FlgA
MEAMQDGRMGEQVKLKNPDSGKQVSGVVTGPNAAKGL